jgi:hypothetical protein
MMAIRWSLLAWGVVLGALFSARVSAFQDRIVIVSDRADTATLPLLRGELRQLGLEVIEIESNSLEVVGHELTEAARLHHAVAAFRVRVSSHTVEVWIADRATGNVSLREVFTQGPNSSDEARLVVLQAVELLRWNLKYVEPRVSQPREPNTARASTNSSVEVEPRGGRVFFGVAPVASFSPGGASPGAGAQLDVTLRWSFIGTRFGYAQPLLPASIDALGSQAELSTRWLSIQLVLLGGSQSSRLRPSIGLGAAMVLTTLHGIASSPRVASDDRLFSVAPIVDARLGYAVTPQIRLYAGVSALVPLRSDSLVFEGKPVGTYGALFVAPALGIEAAIP